MAWTVRFHDEFEKEFNGFTPDLQDELLARLGVLREFGPMLGRPNVDTLYGSKFPNMKELRFDFEKSAWRVAFAFDHRREAIVLVADDKSGISQKRFYERLIARADKRFQAHLKSLEDPTK